MRILGFVGALFISTGIFVWVLLPELRPSPSTPGRDYSGFMSADEVRLRH